MSDIKRIFKNGIAHVTLVLSVALLLLFFADAAYPSELYVNSRDTGIIMIVYSVFAFTAAIMRITYSFHGRSEGILSLVLPHGVIVMVLLTLTLSITNIFNRSMGFVTSDMSKLAFSCLSVLGACLSLSIIECIYKESDKK